ncbi:MAG: TolC family protein [Deltaproteobacteria bacterium]|nr:TolC family protein [Deltaproteobacteria bacterium]
MKKIFIAAIAFLYIAGSALADEPGAQKGPGEATEYSLRDVIEVALKNNPDIMAAEKRLNAEDYSVDIAKAGRLPTVNLNGGVTRYRYAQPVTPITGSPLKGGFPAFDDTIYDFGVSFTLPLYMGGRITRGITIAEMRKSAAEDTLNSGRQELTYNLTSVYYKISQLTKLLESNEATVKGLEEHRKNAELSVKAGVSPRADLLKSDVEFGHAKQNSITIRNNIEGSYVFLKTLMGIGLDEKLSLQRAGAAEGAYPVIDESIARALNQRPAYKALQKKKRIAGERVKYAEGKRLPSVSLNGEYGDRSGTEMGFKENWFLGLRLTLPVFDGGVIKSEISREKTEADIVNDEERSLRNEIIREIKDAYLSIADSKEKINTALAAIEAATENLRVERLKFQAGSGITADVIDAEAALLRARTDYYQSVYEMAIAEAALKKAVGEEI